MSRSSGGIERSPRLSVAARLFITVWIVYSIHFASNVVRETYLAIALGEKLSVRVDEYLGLHPDLFEIPGKGSYINSNPGASMLGAIPYAIARPVIAGIFRAKPELARPKPAATYADPRPNRTTFMNESRRRGLDVKLALAAASMHAGLMAPLGALGALVMFLFLRARLRDERKALWLSLLYAFGTPIFFRSAFLNQNAIVTHAVLIAYVLLVGLRPFASSSVDVRGSEDTPRGRQDTRIVGAGALLGLCVLCDYSGVALAVAFGVWCIWEGWRRGGKALAFRWPLLLMAGALGPLLLLFIYQWVAFGNLWLPAQTYMPPTEFSVRGWHGFTIPSLSLLFANLFDPGYGLFVFCPMLLAALAAPFMRNRERDGGPSGSELVLIFGTGAALYLFASSVQFAAMQFNTGVRYMVPAVPLLFIALVPVLLRLPRWAAAGLVVPTVIISWSVAMTREPVPTALSRIFTSGLELPWLTVLSKMSGAYAPFLAAHPSPIPVFVLIGLLLWLLWRKAQLPERTG
ncbi:MAG: DUF2079 domain-containing protein [Gemmatimonadota bacterium]|nr:DUF2079 domain-containing protein [Gemmatimonadota bacterium]